MQTPLLMMLSFMQLSLHRLSHNPIMISNRGRRDSVSQYSNSNY